MLSVSNAIDWISNPLTTIHTATIKKEASSTSSNASVADMFSAQLFLQNNDDEKQPLLVDRIPFLTVSSARHHSLVRFRCMVQNNGLNSELYPKTITLTPKSSSADAASAMTLRSGYSDEIWTPNMKVNEWDISYSSAPENLDEKQPLVCVAIPAETEWHMRSESGNSGANVPYPHSIIAKLYSNPDMAKYNLNSVHEFIGVFERSNADAAAADADSHEEEEEDVFGGLNDEERVFDAMPKLHVLYAREIDMNGDIKKEAAVATDLDTASSSLDKNQIKAVRENLVAALTSVLNGDQLSAEYLVCHIFARLVNNTQLDAAPGLPLNIFNFKETLEEDKNDSNKDANCDKDILALVNLLESLLPRCKTIPLSLEHLNKAIFSPCMDDGGKDKEEVAKKEEEKKKKEEDGDKREEEPVPTFINCGTILKRGECQVANGTQLIFDETKLVPGKLFERGLRNLQCVQGLVRSGSLSCQLGGGGGEMKLQMEGVSCLVLSVRKCMFPMDTLLPLSPASGNVSSNSIEDLKSCIPLARTFIKEMSSRWNLYNIPESLAETISDFYANKMRSAQENTTTTSTTTSADEQQRLKQQQMQRFGTAMDLSKILDVARGLALSYGLLELDANIWEKAVEMEKERRERLERL